VPVTLVAGGDDSTASTPHGQHCSGLPDGFFSNQKFQFAETLEGLAMEDVSIFYVHLINFPDIWYILWPFGTFLPVVVHFYPFWYVVPRKIRQPCLCGYI
jgi:hypothetical protein